MINPCQSITSYEGEDFEAYLNKIMLFSIFEPVIKEFPEKHIFKGIIQFICWGYSMDSDMLSTTGNNWGTAAGQIFKRTLLPEDLYEDVVLMKNEHVRHSIQKWLQFQDNENWTQFITYRDLRREMLSSSLSDIKTASGEINYEQKMKNAIHSHTLLEMMKNAQETFIQNHPKLRASVDAFNKANDKSKVTRSPASYAV